MPQTHSGRIAMLALLGCSLCAAARAQSFSVQCLTATSLHPSGTASAAYSGPTTRSVTIKQDSGTSFVEPYVDNGGAVKCQQVSGGDGYATMADGTQTYLFGFGPLSGLGLIGGGLPGTQLASDFNKPYTAGPNFMNGQSNPLYNPGPP